MASTLIGRLRALDAGDFYGVLGVSPSASPAQVKNSFRKLALALHPDKSPLAGAKEAFQIVSNAYTCLVDPAKRKEFDIAGTAAQYNVDGSQMNNRFRARQYSTSSTSCDDDFEFGRKFNSCGCDCGSFVHGTKCTACSSTRDAFSTDDESSDFEDEYFYAEDDADKPRRTSNPDEGKEDTATTDVEHQAQQGAVTGEDEKEEATERNGKEDKPSDDVSEPSQHEAPAHLQQEAAIERPPARCTSNGPQGIAAAINDKIDSSTTAMGPIPAIEALEQKSRECLTRSQLRRLRRKRAALWRKKRESGPKGSQQQECQSSSQKDGNHTVNAAQGDCEACGIARVTLVCPTCKNLGLQPHFFCSRKCFRALWAEHKALHKP